MQVSLGLPGDSSFAIDMYLVADAAPKVPVPFVKLLVLSNGVKLPPWWRPQSVRRYGGRNLHSVEHHLKSLYNALAKQRLCYDLIDSPMSYDLVVATRFDVWFSKPVPLPTLDPFMLNVVPSGRERKLLGQNATRLAFLVPDFLAAARPQIMRIWMSSISEYERLLNDFFVDAAGSYWGRENSVPGAGAPFALVEQTEIFKCRQLRLHGVAAGQTRHGITLLDADATFGHNIG